MKGQIVFKSGGVKESDARLVWRVEPVTGLPLRQSNWVGARWDKVIDGSPKIAGVTSGPLLNAISQERPHEKTPPA